MNQAEFDWKHGQHGKTSCLKPLTPYVELNHDCDMEAGMTSGPWGHCGNKHGHIQMYINKNISIDKHISRILNMCIYQIYTCVDVYIYKIVSLRIIKIQTSNMKPSKPTCAHLGARPGPQSSLVDPRSPQHHLAKPPGQILRPEMDRYISNQNTQHIYKCKQLPSMTCKKCKYL